MKLAEYEDNPDKVTDEGWHYTIILKLLLYYWLLSIPMHLI